MMQDDEHLRWLSIGYFVTAGLHVLFALVVLAYAGIMFTFFKSGSSSGAPAPPAFVGYFVAIFAGVGVLFGFVTATLNLLCGLWLGARKNRSFCLVVAGVNCLNAPHGTLLGVFTFIVLGRPNVRAQFETAP